MRARHIPGVAVGAALAVFAMGTPGSAAVAQGQWSGSGSSPCSAANCMVDAVSYQCAEVTTVGNVTISVEGCSARLTGSHSRFRSGATYVCVGLGTGTLSYVDSNGTPYPAINVTLAVDDGTLTYRGTMVQGVETFLVQGTLTPACAQGGTFTGTLSRV